MAHRRVHSMDAISRLFIFIKSTIQGVVVVVVEGMLFVVWMRFK